MPARATRRVRMNIKDLLEHMIEVEASDLHIKPGIPPVVRVNGKLQRTDFPAPRILR